MTASVRKYAIIGFLVHSLAAGQEKHSESVLQFLQKPRLGEAQLTRRDGQTQKGRILRVTDQFIAFETNLRPRACENVALSEIAAVQSLRTPGAPGVGSYVAEVFYLGILLGPFFAADAIAEPFKRLSPPLKPLLGMWDSGESRGGHKSSLEFTGGTVRSRTTVSKHGRWLIEHDRLHLILDGEPEWISSFHFECGALILDDPREVLSDRKDHRPAAAPIVGDWQGQNLWLNLRPDGSLAEQKFSVRQGTFENTSTSVRIHWTDSTGPGGGEWIAPIEHRRIVVSVNGVTTKYRYEPPSILAE